MANKCQVCDQTAQPDKEIICDFCKDAVHTICSGLSRIEIQCLKTKDRRISYYCLNCNSLKNQIAQLKDISSKVASLENELKNLKSCLSEKNTNIENNSTNLCAEDFISELQDRQNRAHNIIVFNVAESLQQNINDRRADDEANIKDILQVFEDNEIDLSNLKMFRLGSRIDGRNRPIKVCLKNPADVLRILKNKNKLRNPIIKIYNDMTPMQREHLKKLQEELRALRNAGDHTKTIKYINNVPKIVSSNSSKN